MITNQPATNSVGVMLGGFATASYPTAPNPRNIVVADFNGDGRTDIVTTHHETPGLAVLRNQTFRTRTSTRPRDGTSAG